MNFRNLGIDEDICDALDSKSITQPFPIQQQAIPLALSGVDMIGQAKTGTGKTFGFGLPMLQLLGPNPQHLARGLVVVPTRELALQVAEDLRLASKNRTTRVVEIYGGKSYESQIEELGKGADVVVGTPGRLLDLHKQKLINLSAITYLVLDEADEMLDLGFFPDIEKMFALLPPERQTLLFSATMPAQILSLARRYQRKPIHIRASDPDQGKTKADIKQVVYRAHALDKDEVLGRILQAEGRGKTVIFVRTKRLSAKLSEELVDRGFNAAPLHGDMAQVARERSMAAFRSGKKDVLVATEVAARGIDVDDVTHVINYSVPEDEKAYLHRTGRTGRAGKLGVAVTFVDWADLARWTHIDRELELGMPEPVETYSSSAHLFEDLGIPVGTKGRLRPTSAKPTEKPQQERRGSRPGQQDRQQDKQQPKRNRERRRNYKGASKPSA